MRRIKQESTRKTGGLSYAGIALCSSRVCKHTYTFCHLRVGVASCTSRCLVKPSSGRKGDHEVVEGARVTFSLRELNFNALSLSHFVTAPSRREPFSILICSFFLLIGKAFTEPRV